MKNEKEIEQDDGLEICDGCGNEFPRHEELKVCPDCWIKICEEEIKVCPDCLIKICYDCWELAPYCLMGTPLGYTP